MILYLSAGRRVALGPQCYTRAPGGVTFDTDCFSQSTRSSPPYTVSYAQRKRRKNCKKQIVKWNNLHVVRVREPALERAFPCNFTCLGAPER